MNKLLCVVIIVIAAVTSKIAKSNNPVNDKLVIVLHLQDHFIQKYFTEENSESFIQNINKVTESATPDNVIYVKMIHRAILLGFTKVKIDTIPFPGGDNLDKRLNIVSDNVYSDIEFNIFKSENLNKIIKESGFKDIILTGLLAEECIAKSAKKGLKQGYNIYIIPEATIGKTEKSKEKALEKLKVKGVKELPIESIRCNI